MMANETVQEFMARGGIVTVAPGRKAYGAQKIQKIKVPVRFLGRIR
jgi:hypothetical protein